MSEVRFEVSRTRGDIFKGIAANLLRSPGSLAWYIGGAALVAGIAVWSNRYDAPESLLLIGLVAFVAMLALYCMIMLACVLFAAQKTWRMQGALDPVAYTFSADGLAVVAKVGHGHTAWSDWKTAFETRSLIVIRHQFNLIHVIPKRQLSADVLRQIRTVLSQNLKNARLQPATAEGIQ